MSLFNPGSVSESADMEDEERRRKLEAGKAKLAEYRQRKAESEGQKRKRKRKNKESELHEGKQQEEEEEECEERKDSSSTQFTFTRTLCSGGTVTHTHTLTIEPESEITTTAEDYTSEDEDEEEDEEQEMENELTAKNMAVEELGQELGTTLGADGVQQLQEFEAALKHRDGIITQLTANLQQARAERDEVMREFLDLTEKSQKLQIQFQQLQAGESLRSSSISSAAADLLQTRQQVLLYQQQLEEKHTTVTNLRLQLEEKHTTVTNLRQQLEEKQGKIASLTEETDHKVKGLQEQLEESVHNTTSLQEQISEMTQVQKRMSELEKNFRDTEILFTQRLQEKDLQIKEQERLVLEHQQSLAQLRDHLHESEEHLANVREQLDANVRDLQSREAELQASREKEQLSSGEILQLMGTVEALQKHHHQGSLLESEVLQRAELNTAQRLDHLRAELDEMYGQQIVQMKQELVTQHKEEMANVLNRHRTELRRVSDQHDLRTQKLTSQLSQSTGDTNALNVRVIELQQRLQEVQVLREKAEHDLTQTSEEKVLLQTQVQHLMENLRLKEQEKSQSEVQLQLTSTITDLRAQLASVQEASSELKAKHESEVTNYQIKLEMLEREKDAVLDRMAESQEAELERLRTQLLFSHEEELRRLRQDLQRESQMNVENLRDELNQRHQESVQKLCRGYEERVLAAEEQRSVFSAERSCLLQEIITLKTDLNRALENSRVEELVAQLKNLQAEVQELRQRRTDEEEEPHKLNKQEVTEEKWREIESENKQLKETKVALMEELTSLQEDHNVLTKKMDSLISENKQAKDLAEELRAEITRHKTTFSFAQKNFEVNYQELRAELEERLRVQTLQYQTKLQDQETSGSIQRVKEQDEEPDAVEKHTTELMEKLQRVEVERAELVQQVERNASEIKELKELINGKNAELQKVRQENTGFSEQLEQKEEKLRKMVLERAGLAKQVEQKEAELERLQLLRAELEEQTKSKDLELKRADLERAELLQQVDQKEAELNQITKERAELVQQVDQKEAELKDQLPVKKAGLKAAKKSRQKGSRAKSSDPKLDSSKKSQMKIKGEELLDQGAGQTGQCSAPPLSPAAEEDRRRETLVCVLHRNDGVKQQAHTHKTIRAAEETHTRSHTHTHTRTRTHTHTRTHTQPAAAAAAASHTAKENKLKRDTERQVECYYGDPHLVPALTADMEGNEHDECRLQLEAQRISLSQIHAAQLELLKETLPGWVEPEWVEPEWVEPERQRVAKVCSSSLISITQDFTQFLQLIAGVCGVDSVDVTEEQLQNLPPSTIRDILHKTQELYQKLQQLNTSFSPCATKSTVCDGLSIRTEDDVHTSTLTDIQEEVEEEEDLQEEVEEQHRQEEEKEEVEEVERLRCNFSEQIRETEERYIQEVQHLQDRLKELKPTETHGIAGISAEENQVPMRQYVMEEEIARVIVQMSVEFARQSEMSRVAVQEETREGAEPERGRRREEEEWRGGGVEEVTSQLTSVETQERVDQVLMDLLNLAVLMEETVRDESTTGPADEPETDKRSSSSRATDTDQGLDVCREAGLAVERAGSLWSVCSRLQKTVEKLIFTLTDTHTQLDHARLTQTELMKEKFTYDQQITDLLKRQEELQRRLEEERTARERLSLQLQHAEGLIDGYSDERRALEEQVREGAGRQQELEAELQVTNSQLQELHQERQEVTEQKDLLLRQQDAVMGGVTEAELRLLEETEKLLQEKVDVQRQAQKDHTELLERVKHLEAELEEQVRSTAKVEETHQSVTSDLHQQIHALEKQLEKNRRFLDEQAADREQERDVFQQEIQKLEQELRGNSKTRADHREVERLSVALQEKADWCSELCGRVQQLQEEVRERDEEMERQEERVRVLEAELVSHGNRHIPSAPSAAEDSKQNASMEGGAGATLEALLQTEREALDRKEKEIGNLEEQLEQFRDELQNKSEEVQQLHMQLEIQRKEISTQQQDLHTHTRLKTEVEVKNQLVSELESQVEYLRGEQDRLKRGSEVEVEQLNSVIEKLQQEISNIEHKQPVQEGDDPEEDQPDQLKLEMDQVQRALDTLREENVLLSSKYRVLQEERDTKEENEKKNEMLVHELNEMLRDKIAALVVAQVQIRALEENASSMVSGLNERVEQLQTCLEEQGDELKECKSQEEEAKSEAGTLRLKVSQLEDKLREKMIDQEPRETDIQTKEPQCEIISGTSLEDDERELKMKHEETSGVSIGGKEMSLTQQDQDNGGKEMSNSALTGSGSEVQCGVNATENLLFLMEKLRKMEVDLSSMPQDQELQKHLLASSTEAVGEYEEMLRKLMKILDQMRSTPSSAAAPGRSSEDSTVIEELHQKLHEVKRAAESTERELKSCKELIQRLEQQVEEREETISMLKDQMRRTLDEAERLEDLHLIEHQTSANEEELNKFKQQNLKLQEQIQARDASVVQLMEELQHLRTNQSGGEKHCGSPHRFTGQEEDSAGGQRDSAGGQRDSAGGQRDRSSLSCSSPAAPSADRLQCVSTREAGTQVEGAGLGAELGAGLEEVIGEYSQRIGQIRELHAAEIMDMENRHITESESLKTENRRLQQECVTLREQREKLRPLQVMRSDRSTSSVYRDGYTSDSSSDVGTPCRSTPEGAQQDDTHLPDRIKSLLREVHQEGMQVLSLSEFGVCDESVDHSSLLAQITHLQTELTQLRQDTHTNQQLHATHTERQTETDRQVEECDRLRAELAQVRLELKTSLKTQHTHKRELDTLRAEVCVKVSELDAVSERLAEEQRRARELQWEVERERSRTDRRTEGQREELEDMKLALEEKRLVLAQKDTELAKYTGLVTQLQVQLESHNSRLKEMRSDLHKEKELNAELLKHTQHPLQVEDGVGSVADGLLQSLQVQLEEKQSSLMELRTRAEETLLQELEEKQQWQEERRLLQRRVEELHGLWEGERERGRATERERERLESRVSQMMERSSTTERVREPVLQQEPDDWASLVSPGLPVLSTTGLTHTRDMESAVAKLQQMSSEIIRLSVGGADHQSISWLLRNLQEVISFLQKPSSMPTEGPEGPAQLTGGASSVLSERLLRQNAELTGFVSRLTEEKNEQRNQILSLEEELRRQRHLKPHSSQGFGAEVSGGTLEVQKELWTREKSRMEKALLRAEAEVSRLQADVRADAVRDLNPSDADSATIKRIYGKYLRAESFRKALIYQKKYLLLLLGGFQECEEATLSLIAGMSSPPVHTHTSLMECVSQPRRGYSRFRSAARVCIALFRMRFLVRRWQKVTGGSTTITRNGVGQSPVIEVRTDSPYLQPRGTTRGRTGRESPHTTHTTHHRYGGMVTDGGVLCSHLQSYDPDRALSDYITRLEALQRRLGSVQSGSSFTQMHFGLRR